MTENLEFRHFDAAAGLSSQRALFRDCFPETIGQPAGEDRHYFWKFHGFPCRPPSYEYGAWLGEEMIGYYAAIPYAYSVGGRQGIAGMVCDVMTGNRARGKGVFTRLGAYALAQMQSAGIDFVTGYPIRPEVIPGHLKVGWQVVQKMPIYIKVLRTDSLLRLKKLGFLAFLGNAGAACCNLIPDLKPAGKAYLTESMTVEEFLKDDGYPEFLQSWMKTVPNALDKNRDFLRWRLGAPAAQYRVFVARVASRAIVAVCISRSTVLEKIPSLALLDLMILPGHERSFRVLDRALRGHARQSGSELIATMIHPDWACRYGLGAMLYLKSPYVFSLIVKKLNGALDDASLFSSGRWHTMWIDSDDL